MKPIIALCFAIGAAALGSVDNAGSDVSAVPEPGETEQTTDLEASDQDTLAVILAGLATMSLAAITPFTVLRLFPWEGTEATEGTRGKVSGAVTGPAKTAAVLGAAAASGGASAGAAGASGGAAAGQAASSGGAAAAGAATTAASRASR